MTKKIQKEEFLTFAQFPNAELYSCVRQHNHNSGYDSLLTGNPLKDQF